MQKRKSKAKTIKRNFHSFVHWKAQQRKRDHANFLFINLTLKCVKYLLINVITLLQTHILHCTATTTMETKLATESKDPPLWQIFHVYWIIVEITQLTRFYNHLTYVYDRRTHTEMHTITQLQPPYNMKPWNYPLSIRTFVSFVASKKRYVGVCPLTSFIHSFISSAKHQFYRKWLNTSPTTTAHSLETLLSILHRFRFDSKVTKEQLSKNKNSLIFIVSLWEGATKERLALKSYLSNERWH